MKYFALLMLMGLVAGMARAEISPAEAARDAARQLETASLSLQEADSARDRVAALTQTVQGFEAGLAALREGLRRAAIREAQIGRELKVQEDEIARLLGVLQTMGQGAAPVMLLHPQGPMGTARSGMILAEVAPALNERARSLRKDLQEVTVLRALQQSAADKLQDGLEGAQSARAALSQAIADRTDLPKRFTEDPVQTALLVASTETLEGFASGLSQIAVDEAPGSLPGISDRKGELPLPVKGTVLRRAGEADAAGITRPGIVMATRPRALVTTPAPATVRYRGSLLDYGNVIILEPQAGILLVIAGLDVVYGKTGEVLPGGSPVGLMGGPDTGADDLLTREGSGTGAGQTETLYVEVRQDNTPVDPEAWFKTDRG